MLPFEIYALGDRGITVSFSNSIDEKVNETCHAFAQRLKALQLAGIRDVVPAYSSVSVYYDPIAVKKLPGVTNAHAALITKLNSLLKEAITQTAAKPRHLKVPVCYDPSLAPDLEELSSSKAISIKDIIHLHTSVSYKVYMLGFLPGFPYMGTVHEKLVSPRKKQPHVKLEAGSVGIAGLQTGIYPLESPGGWNIIGQTPLQIFDPATEALTYFQPGDIVSFYSIELTEFYKMQNQ